MVNITNDWPLLRFRGKSKFDVGEAALLAHTRVARLPTVATKIQTLHVHSGTGSIFTSQL